MAQEQSAFAGVIRDPLAGRIAKPRRQGLTMVIDKGLGLSQTSDLLELAGEYIDYIKFGFGTAALYRRELLCSKVAMIRAYGVEPYPGGTFFETAWSQGRFPEYLAACREVGFRLVEVSDGTIHLSPVERKQAISIAREKGFLVITEVGKKDVQSHFDPSAALLQVKADLATGSNRVILEGRESGKGVGLYDGQGRLKSDQLQVLLAGLEQPDAIIWEAPLKEQQQELIGLLGPNVNLGNIATDEVIALEALRVGLRGDTLRLALGRG